MNRRWVLIPKPVIPFLEIIREIAQSGTTILFTTHHLEEAEALCERIAIIDHGKILQTGTVDELAHEVGTGKLITIRGDFQPAQFKSSLEGLPLTFVNLSNQEAVISLSNSDIGIACMVQKLSEAGLEIDDLSIQKPNLETVFLKLTGRELRD